jgi:hypothetical protein
MLDVNVWICFGVAIELEAQESTRKISIEEPAIVILHYFNSLAGFGCTCSICISFFKKLSAASKSVIVFEGAVGVAEIEYITNTTCDESNENEGTQDCNGFS